MGAKALMISHMFPNAEDRIMGVFVEEKARALGLYIPTTVVAPVSYFPFVRWRTSIDEFEEVRGLKIHHPRYLALPSFQFGRRWLPYYLSLNRFLKGQDRRATILF